MPNVQNHCKVSRPAFRQNTQPKKGTGNLELQIALINERIAKLTERLMVHEMDSSSRRSRLKMVNTRKSLLQYLSHTDRKRYRAIITKQGPSNLVPAVKRAVKSKPTPAADSTIKLLERLCQAFNMPQTEFAVQILNCSPRSLLLWKSGKIPNRSALTRLHELNSLYEALTAMMAPEDIAPWMKRTNDYLTPLTPIEVIARGEVHRLWHIIHNVRTGMPT